MNINEIAQWVIDNRYPKSELEKVSDHELYYGLIEKLTSLPTSWTPITGEASLPKDDEALCLFAEWEGDLMKDRWIVKWKVAKTDISHHHFTHYTILTEPIPFLNR
mgnify:CR=1 FL=1